MIQCAVSQRQLRFRFEAKTSRGSLWDKWTYFVHVYDTRHPEHHGIGEAAPLEKLSPEANPNFEDQLMQCVNAFNQLKLENLSVDFAALLGMVLPKDMPSVYFAFEVALMDYLQGGDHCLYDNSFFQGKSRIPINGLIWMGNKLIMREQIEAKLQNGYTCIKMKIGAIQLEDELNLLQSIRDNYSAEQVTLRVDANGAFNEEQVDKVLGRLGELGIHSIEQPVSAKQKALMQSICKHTQVPIALDEQLIGLETTEEKARLLDEIAPQYIVLKPTLLGGLAQANEWIRLAEERSIGWWMTSALESNIGLNAIAQFTAEKNPSIPQGLGTGKLFHNNVASPLEIDSGHLVYKKDKDWEDLFSEVEI